MIAPFRILISYALQVVVGTAAPVGICLHAYSPEAPAEKIECFEFERVERTGADYRFFPRAGKSVMVTAYRFRGAILYKPDLAPTHPEFDKQLKLYESTARATPSTRAFLNPKILAMRSQSAAVTKQAESVAALPTITTADGTKLVGCTVSKIEGGFVSVRHQNGISKISLNKLDATQKKTLNSTTDEWSVDEPSATPKDSTGTFAKIVFKNGRLLKKVKFKEVADGNLVFMADGKSVVIPVDQFPGELSVLGEEVVQSFSAKNPASAPISPKTPAKAATDESDTLIRLGDAASKEGWASKELMLALKNYGKAEELGHPEATKKIRMVMFWLAENHLGKEGEDKSQTARWYRMSAERGSARGQWGLAKCLQSGHGVEVDIVEFLEWARKAAESGLLDAQMGLGEFFGRSRAKMDRESAAEWYRKAAERGVPEAQFELALLIDLGFASSDPGSDALESSTKWYERAACQEVIQAQFALGLKYYQGRELTKDNIKAYMWLSLASAKDKKNTDLDPASFTPASILRTVTKNMSARQIQEGEKMIADWKPKYPIAWRSKEIEELEKNGAD
jgi:TPR repeat protein